jgi:hypothetical protein
MNSYTGRSSRPIRARVTAIALSSSFACLGASCVPHHSVKGQNAPGTIGSSRPMLDGKHWTTDNLNVDIDVSYCYDDAELNCRRYGRLYNFGKGQLSLHRQSEGEKEMALSVRCVKE